MLREVVTDHPTRFRMVNSRPVEVLCDDGMWHFGVVLAEQLGPFGWEVQVRYYSGNHNFCDWLVYCAAAIRPADDPEAYGPNHVSAR
jgi:hypothetical protein